MRASTLLSKLGWMRIDEHQWDFSFNPDKSEHSCEGTEFADLSLFNCDDGGGRSRDWRLHHTNSRLEVDIVGPLTPAKLKIARGALCLRIADLIKTLNNDIKIFKI